MHAHGHLCMCIMYYTTEIIYISPSTLFCYIMLYYFIFYTTFHYVAILYYIIVYDDIFYHILFYCFLFCSNLIPYFMIIHFAV